MNCPLISVIIPAHNGSAYIGEAIKSILYQDYPNFEIIVIDNGSIDSTAEIVKTFHPVIYFSTPDADTAKARNLGISHAKGEYVAFLDQDDIWLPHKLTKQMQFLQQHKNYKGVVCFQKMQLAKNCEKPHWLKAIFLDTPQPAYLPSALMVEKIFIQTTGQFDTRFSLASDVAWFFKMRDANIQIGMIDEVLIERKIHQANASNKIQALYKEYFSIIRESIHKKRLTHETTY